MLLFYGHPTCTTCKKAQKWLDEKEVAYEWKDIREETPNRDLLKHLLKEEIIPRRRLFNTSGNLYKELQLKDRLDSLSIEEAVALLKDNGMLIRRPFLTDGTTATAGFKEEIYQKIWMED